MCACTQSHTGRWLDEGGDKTCLFSCHALCVSSFGTAAFVCVCNCLLALLAEVTHVG